MNDIQTKCTFSNYDDFISSNVNDLCSSMCPLECESSKLDISTSSSTFPTRSFYELYKENKYFKELFQSESITYDDLRESILEVNIYYETFKYTKTGESPVSTIIDLVSNIGGTLGLFIGISLLSLVEILEIIAEFILTLFFSFSNIF